MELNKHEKLNIAILGGGISGLSTGYFLTKMFPHSRITLFEKTPEVGGAIKTIRSNNFLFELGPKSIRNSPTLHALVDILNETQLTSKIITSETFPNAYLYYDGCLRSVPRSKSLGVLLRFLWDHPKIFSSLSETYVEGDWGAKRKISKDHDISVSEYLKGVFHWGPFYMAGLHRFVQGHLVDALMKGIYACELEDLSSNICLKKNFHKDFFNKFFAEEELSSFSDNYNKFNEQILKKAGSFNLEGGLENLPQMILENLKKNRNFEYKAEANVNTLKIFRDNSLSIIYDDLKTNSTVEQKFDKVVCALPLKETKTLLEQASNCNEEALKPRINSALDILRSIRLQSLANVSIGYNKDVLPEKYRSFGYLVPGLAQEDLLGAVFDSCSFPSLNPNKSENASRFSLMMGGSTLEKYHYNIAKLESLSRQLLQKHVGIGQMPDEVKTTIWDNFFPVYEPGHYNKILKLLASFQAISPNLLLHGNFLFSAAVPEIVIYSKCVPRMMLRSQDWIKDILN